MAGWLKNDALTEGQAAVRRLLGLGGGLVLLVLVGVMALLFAGSRALDDLQAREDRVLARTVLDRSLRRVVTDLTTATVWDQAYSELKPGGSLKWADEEIGSYFANNRDHDWTVVIDPHGRPFYAWVGGGRADAAAQGRFLADSAPVIAQARALERKRHFRPPSARPTDPSLSETAAGVVVSGGVPYLVAASTVIPENAATARKAGPSVLVISGQRADRGMIDHLNRMQLRDVRLQPGLSTSPAAIVVRDVSGRLVGSIVWQEEHAGVEALSEAAPVIALGLVVVGLLAAALGSQIWRVARRLDVHERAHDMTLADLAEARDRAETANVAKSQFLANMSHEIRTPLNGVLGMAQVLAKSKLAPTDRDKLQVIRSSGETLLSLLNDLLDLSKIEAGKMDIDVHDFDLDEAVAAATRSFATLAGQKDVAFLVEVDEAARGVWRGDGGRFRQVLANLASNAVKFTSEGEVRVSVRRVAAGIACTVADSGAGIARDRLEQLFQRFSQVDPTATRRFGGTGLGLAISRELVELMGGKVAVTSVEGRGSAFSFDLPLDWVGPATAAPVSQDEAELPPIRVLAAEDNATNQLLLRAILDPLGVDLRVTANGAETVAAFRAERFDLILMDIQMPVMNGVDATRAIRAIEADEARAPTPILALSANVMRHQIDDYMAAGMNGFVAKPIELPTLIAAMEQALTPPATGESVAA